MGLPSVPEVGDRLQVPGSVSAMPSLDAALTVPCPTCHVPAGQSCRSRHAVTLHQSRRQALADLGVQADEILAVDRQQRRAAPGPAGAAPPVPVLVGRTGTEDMIPETAEYWPTWEEPPVAGCLAESGIPVTGLVWCPVHEEYEELCDGVPAMRLVRE